MNVEAVSRYITDWLDDYCSRAGMDGFVVGVSGGIDSAVCSALAARTRRPTHLAELSIHQSEEQVLRAHAHIKMLQQTHPAVVSHHLNLTDTFETLIQALPRGGKDEARALSLANTRSRLRMTSLYYLAGINRALVVGTGNKVEDFGVGFFTKYGDGGVDVSPIADLYKTEVYALGEYLRIIPEIMNAPPTDGLFGDSRTDESQIGATYPELEWAMKWELHGGEEQYLEARQKEVLRIYRNRHRANQHKMKAIPICKIPFELK